MSKFPWEQAGQKKEGGTDGDVNAAPGIPPFAADVPNLDLFQKAFSDNEIQETSIASPEKSLSFEPSAVSSPLFSMEMPDLSSLQSKQEIPGDTTPPFILDGKEGALPPFLSKEPPMAFQGAPSSEVKNTPKVQTTSKRPLPVFEMGSSDDDTKAGGSIPSPGGSGIDSMDAPIFPVPYPNLSGPGHFSSPPFPQPAGNNPSPQFSPLDTPAQPVQSAAIVGSGNPLDAVTGPSPFAGDPSSADPFSASRDPFVQSSGRSAADPFAAQANPFGAFPGPYAPVPFPSSGVNSPFSGNPFPDSVAAMTEKKKGIGSKMADVSENLATSIGELANSIVTNVRNLSKGKSLLEKMEKIKEGNILEDEVPLQLSASSVHKSGIQANGGASASVPDMSPFGPGSSGSSPFAPPGGTESLSPAAPIFPQADVADGHDIRSSDDFVKVTPVENPLYDFPEELKLDNGPQPFLSTHSDMAKDREDEDKGTKDTVFPMGTQDVQDREMPDIAAIMKQKPSGIPYQPQKATEATEEVPFSAAATSSNAHAPVRSSDLDEIKERLDLSAGNISQVYGMYEQLSGNMTVLEDSVRSLQNSSDDVMKATGMKFDDLDERVSKLESHLSGIEQQVAHVQSENKNILSGLSSIEKHISELVGSYTALVSKMQENAQENDDNLSALSGKIASMENVVPRIASMERSGTETSAAVQDLKGNVAKLATDVLNVSASQQEIRDEMTELSKYAEGELKKIGARGYKVAGQSIQLAHIMKNSTSIKLCMEWLEFLMELVGRNNLPDILSYYEELGWITEEVRMELMRYAEGIDFYMEKPDWKLNPDDHVKSIWFIENLAGIKVDKNKLSVIDRDIEKVRKGPEMYNI
ncbi:MAG: hypothetical protein KK926_00820 [Methanomethylovorans sp.]|nr:hypothetical protein [Methanomethylovorans sp.]